MASRRSAESNALKDSSGRRVAYVYGRTGDEIRRRGTGSVADARYVAEKLRLLPKLLERAKRGGLPAFRPDLGTF